MESSEEKPPAYVPPHRRRQQRETVAIKKEKQGMLEFTRPEHRKFYETSGTWMISCDYKIQNENGLTELDRHWIVAKEMFDEGLFTKVVCYTATYITNYSTRSIYCFVPDWSDLENIIRTAAELRRRLPNYPYAICMKTSFKKGCVAESKYLCCADGDLYAFESKSWALVKTSICTMSA